MWKMVIIDEPRAFAAGPCCRVTSAVKIVGILELFHLFFVAMFAICFVFNGKLEIIGVLVFVLLGFLAVWRLFNAVDSSVPGSVIPYLIFRYTLEALYIPLIGICALAASNMKDDVAFSIGFTREQNWWLMVQLWALLTYAAVSFVLGMVYLALAHQTRSYLIREEASKTDQLGDEKSSV